LAASWACRHSSLLLLANPSAPGYHRKPLASMLCRQLVRNNLKPRPSRAAVYHQARSTAMALGNYDAIVMHLTWNHSEEQQMGPGHVAGFEFRYIASLQSLSLLVSYS